MTLNASSLAEWDQRRLDAVDTMASELGWALLRVHSITATGGCTCGNAACHSPGKHAIDTSWQTLATSDPAQLARWFHPGVFRNIGIHAGLSRIGIVDIDGPVGMETYQHVVGKGRHEWTPLVVKSGRNDSGFHLYFDHALGNVPYLSLHKLEVRVGNHYHLAPPSRHVDGNEYSVIRGDIVKDGSDLPPLHPLLVEWAQSGGAMRNGVSLAGAPIPAALAFPTRAPVVVPEVKLKEGDGRNTWLYRHGVSLAGKGMPLAQIKGHLQLLNTDNCDPPLDADELDGIVKSVTESRAAKDAPGNFTADTEWAEPIPLGVDIEAAPSFPVDALPSWLATYCRAQAEATQAPVDAIAALVLGVFATAMQERVVVRLQPGDPGWIEETCLFVMLVMPSGAKKSPTFRAAFAPIIEAEREVRRDLEPEYRDARRRVAVAKERAEAARRAVKGGSTSDERYKLEQAYIDADEALEQAEATERGCTPPVFYADDATPEAFVDLLALHGRITIGSAEGGWFGTFAGRYSEGRTNFDALLKGYSGDSIRVHRKGSPPVDIPWAVCSVVVAVQPDVLREMSSTPGAVERGLLARFVKAAPMTRRGYRNVTNPAPMPGPVAAEYAARVAVVLHELRERLPSVANTDGNEPKRVCLEVKLDDEAARMFVDFRQRHEVESRPGGRVHEIDAFAEKHVGNVARIAAVLHFAEHTTDAPGMPISADTLASAIRIGDYFIEQEITLDRYASQSTEVRAAQRVLDWITAEQREAFTTRELHAAKRGTAGLHDVRSVRQALGVLVSHGYIRQSPDDGGKPGRPSEAWHVNPDTHTQNPQNPDRVGSVDIVDAVTGEVAA